MVLWLKWILKELEEGDRMLAMVYLVVRVWI